MHDNDIYYVDDITNIKEPMSEYINLIHNIGFFDSNRIKGRCWIDFLTDRRKYIDGNVIIEIKKDESKDINKDEIEDAKKNGKQNRWQLCEEIYILRRELIHHCFTAIARSLKDKDCIYSASKKCIYKPVIVDIRQFKPFNDQLNYDVGNILINACERYLEANPTKVIVRRYGGDEYLCFLRTGEECDKGVPLNTIERDKEPDSESFNSYIRDMVNKNIDVFVFYDKQNCRLSYFDMELEDNNKRQLLFKYSIKGVEFHKEAEKEENSKEVDKALELLVESLKADLHREPEMRKEASKKLNERLEKYARSKSQPNRGYFSPNVSLLFMDEIGPVAPNRNFIYVAKYINNNDNSDSNTILKMCLEKVYKRVAKAYEVLYKTRKRDKGTTLTVVSVHSISGNYCSIFFVEMTQGHKLRKNGLKEINGDYAGEVNNDLINDYLGIKEISDKYIKELLSKEKSKLTNLEEFFCINGKKLME
jgi:GGDEF domain-containing protein